MRHSVEKICSLVWHRRGSMGFNRLRGVPFDQTQVTYEGVQAIAIASRTVRLFGTCSKVITCQAEQEVVSALFVYGPDIIPPLEPMQQEGSFSS